MPPKKRRMSSPFRPFRALNEKAFPLPKQNGAFLLPSFLRSFFPTNLNKNSFPKPKQEFLPTQETPGFRFGRPVFWRPSARRAPGAFPRGLRGAGAGLGRRGGGAGGAGRGAAAERPRPGGRGGQRPLGADGSARGGRGGGGRGGGGGGDGVTEIVPGDLEWCFVMKFFFLLF